MALIQMVCSQKRVIINIALTPAQDEFLNTELASFVNNVENDPKMKYIYCLGVHVIHVHMMPGAVKCTNKSVISCR